MKIIITYLIILFAGFQVYSQQVSKISSVQDKYRAIRDGLFDDIDGNLYFKTIDLSNSNKRSRFIYVVYSDDFGVNGIKNMKDVVDSESFKSIGNSYYKDKNNIYYFKRMLSGGTLSIVDKVD